MENKNKLFVGNLSYNMSKEELTEVFSAHGAVLEVSIPLNRETNRPRGFAFVTMETEGDTENALALNGTEVMGRKMIVNMANNNGPRTGGSDRGGDRAPRSNGFSSERRPSFGSDRESTRRMHPESEPRRRFSRDRLVARQRSATWSLR